MDSIQSAEKSRIRLILNYTNIFILFFSVLYSSLLLWSHYFDNNIDKKQLASIYFSVAIPIIFYISYILNIKRYTEISKIITFSTILIVNFLMGIKWGFDLPSVLISYLFCIVIVTLISKPKENTLYLSAIILSIFIGNYLHNNNENALSWYGSRLYINDIIEFSIMFIFISFILIRFNREQNKTLTRALRTENILRKERDNLEKVVKEKTKEIKQIQMEELSKIYHLIEFGKLSSGLYHDLITPIQTMNLYIDKLTQEHVIDDSKFSKIIINIKNTHEKLNLMLQNIRKQINLKAEDEKINLILEVNDLINLVKNNYFKNGISINYEPLNKIHILNTKKSILNHILLNLISNAYEACFQDMKINNKEEYGINIVSGKNGGKSYISIIDNGIGIKSENLTKIFEDFYSGKDNKGNCGIGLSSSKYFLEKYLNGKILIESEYNIGTTTTIIF